MTNHRSAESNFSQGYSLAELIVAMACIGVLLGTAVPNMAQLHHLWALWGSARILESSLQWGRMQAITLNAPILFEVDESRQKFYWVDPVTRNPYENSIRHLSNGVRIIRHPKRPLRFYQHGNAAPAGTYVLENQAGTYSVVVTPGGRIRFNRN